MAYPFTLLFIWGTNADKEAFKKERGYGKYRPLIKWD
jgi:hypothetical protein